MIGTIISLYFTGAVATFICVGENGWRLFTWSALWPVAVTVRLYRELVKMLKEQI